MTAKLTRTLEANRTAAAARKKDPIVVAGVPLACLFVVGMAFAHGGWLLENLVRLLTKGVWDCRFHLFPWIPVYALIPFAFCLAFCHPDRIAPFGRPLFRKAGRKEVVLSNLLCLLFICLAVFLGELVVGNLWDALFGVRLWDYGAQFGSVTQYAGLFPTFGYGGAAYLAFRWVYRPLLRYVTTEVGVVRAKKISCVFGILMAVDSIVFVVFAAVHGAPPIYWAFTF